MQKSKWLQYFPIIAQPKQKAVGFIQRRNENQSRNNGHTWIVKKEEGEEDGEGMED